MCQEKGVVVDVCKLAEWILLCVFSQEGLEIFHRLLWVPLEIWVSKVEGVEIVDLLWLPVDYHKAPMTAADVHWHENLISVS